MFFPNIIIEYPPSAENSESLTGGIGKNTMINETLCKISCNLPSRDENEYINVSKV